MPGTTSTAPGAPGAGTSTGAPHPRRWIALAVIAIAQLMVVLDATIVNIALPQAQADLGITDAEPAVGGHGVHAGVRRAAAARRPDRRLLGPQAHLHGRHDRLRARLRPRRPRHRPAACCSPPAPCRARSARCSPRRRWPCSPSCSPRPRSGPRPSRVYGAIAGGGSAVGLLLGGVLTEYADWRWCLLVNIPVAAIAIALAAPAGAGEPGARQHPLRRARRDRGHRRPGRPWSTASPRPPRTAGTPPRTLGFIAAGVRCWPSSW